MFLFVKIEKPYIHSCYFDVFTDEKYCKEAIQIAHFNKKCPLFRFQSRGRFFYLII